MKIKELIEELKKFDEDIEVQYNHDYGYQTMFIEKVSLEHEDYAKDGKEVVIIY